MDSENQKKNLKIKIIISLVFLAVLVVLFFLLSDKKELNMVIKVDPENSYESVDQTEVVANNENEIVETVDKYRQEVPEDIIVPELDTQLSEEQKNEIAVPKIVVPASSGSESNFRSFDIKAENNAFVPNKIIAKVGDVVHVNFSAVGGDYDIVFPSYNMKQVAKSGQTKILEFQAVEEGSFLYYCDSCGGENSNVKGNIIIVE